MIAAIDVLRAASGGEPPRPRMAAEGPDAASVPERLRVLIVEDDTIIAWTLESVLTEMGHEVVDIAPTGEAGLESAAEFEPDVVMMDINLGAGMSGVEAARTMRSRHQADIVFVSAYGDPDTRAKLAIDVPGAPLVGKPVDAAKLDRAIREARRRTH